MNKLVSCIITPGLILFFVIGCSTPDKKTAAGVGVLGSECEMVRNRPEFEAYLRNYKAIISDLDWLKMQNLPVLLVSGTHCAFLLLGDAPVRIIQTKQSIDLLTPVYWFFYQVDSKLVPTQFKGIAQLMSQADPEIMATLSEKGISRALLLRLDFDKEKVGSIPGLRDKVSFLTFMTIHESFHLHGQFPIWFSQINRPLPWPTWDSQPDRKLLIAQCFMVRSFKQELELLMSAVRMSLLENNPKEAQRLRGVYISERERRHNSLRAVQIGLADGRKVSCGIAEAIMEYEEGALDAIAFQRMYDLGLITPGEVFKYLSEADTEPFYKTGLAQILLITGLNSKVHDALFNKILQSSVPRNLINDFPVAN